MTYINTRNVNLTLMDDSIQVIEYKSPIHLVENIPYGAVKNITIGADLRLYGLVNDRIDGVIHSKYIHLGPGDYLLEAPIIFKSLHINNIGI